ncbi:M56 family metallopeptidase [Litoribacter populi]|uniref:M56 family metallopeptidase n=1 Tax=Litoribacter populi TaxID=2598460 RepID=UPI00117FC900|nr:M56 family metallopeptidase [Litoribacter populi]
METFDIIFPEATRIALGWTLMHSMWQILAISILFFIFTKAFYKKNPVVKYKAGLVALTSIVVTTVATLIYFLSLAQNEGSMVMVMSNTGWNTVPAAAKASYLLSLKAYLAQHLHYIVNFWIIGAALFSIRLIGNLAALQNLKKDLKSNLPEKWVSFTSAQAKRMGIKRSIKFGTCNPCFTPITFGVFKPVILIPVSLVFQLTPSQLEAIITHELAHIKRNDYLTNLMQSVLEVLFFYHPCFWWLNANIREQREHATDQMAIASGIEPKCLAQGLAEVLNHSAQNSPEVALAAGSRKNTTLERIKLMLGYSINQPKFPSIISYTMIATLILSATLVAASNPSPNNELLTTISDNIHLEHPRFEISSDTVPQKKVMEFEIIEETEGNQEKDEDEKVMVRTIIINGDTQMTRSPKIIMRKHLDDSVFYKLDTSILDEEKIKKIEKLLEKNAAKMEIAGEDLHKRIMIWSEENHPRMEEFVKKMKGKEVMIMERHKEMTTKLEPKLKELEAKMEEWQKEFGPKMEEFHQKMEEWQQKNDHHFKELEKLMKDAFKEEKPAKKES